MSWKTLLSIFKFLKTSKENNNSNDIVVQYDKLEIVRDKWMLKQGTSNFFRGVMIYGSHS